VEQFTKKIRGFNCLVTADPDLGIAVADQETKSILLCLNLVKGKEAGISEKELKKVYGSLLRALKSGFHEENFLTTETKIRLTYIEKVPQDFCPFREEIR
jgi:hemerythrin